MSFAQRCNYFQRLKLADWQLIITHIQSFIKGWVETEHLWGSGNDPRLVIIIPQLQWVMCAIRLWCYCARAAALAAAGGVFSRRSIKHSKASIVSSTADERVADSLKGRSFVPRLCRKTRRQKWEKATGDNLDRVALSPWRWLFEELRRFFQFNSATTRYFSPTDLIHESVWSYKKEVGYFLMTYCITMCGPHRHADTQTVPRVTKR